MAGDRAVPAAAAAASLGEPRTGAVDTPDNDLGRLAQGQRASAFAAWGAMSTCRYVLAWVPLTFSP